MTNFDSSLQTYFYVQTLISHEHIWMEVKHNSVTHMFKFKNWEIRVITFNFLYKVEMLWKHSNHI